MPLADLGDRSLHYVRGGRGAPLLLIQGMAGHHGMWGELIPLLEPDFDVVAVNHRGIGESSRAEPGFTIADLAADTAALIRSLGWGSANVFGTSMGGMVAQELAIGSPDLVRSLILGCTYAGPDGGSLDSPGPFRLAEAVRAGDARVSLRTGYEVNLSPGYRATDRFGRWCAAALAERVPAAVIAMQIQAAAAHDAVAGLRTLEVPTLVVHGTADEMISVGNAEHIACLVAGARLELLPDVGHLFWWERPETTAKLIREHAL